MFFLNNTDRKVVLFLGIVLLVFNITKFIGTDKVVTFPARDVSISLEVDVNTATISTLQRIPGVGPVTAAKIVQYRDRVRYIRKAEDLLNVKGIGPKTLDKMREYIIF